MSEELNNKKSATVHIHSAHAQVLATR